MKLTTFLSLKKPDYTDSADVQDFNDNMDAIDKKLQDMSTATGDLSNGKIFTAKATDRADINSGETIGTIIGKVMKWFADLKPAAFADIADNDNTTASGYVASASVVKQHGDEIDKANKELGGLYFGKNSSGQYGYATTDGGDIHPFRNPTGNVSAGEVLAGKVFSSASVENGVGTMPNRGTLNWTPGNGTTASVAAGYYSGGTLDSRTAYNQGVSDADGRTNTSSANYKAGYNSGYAKGKADGDIKHHIIVEYATDRSTANNICIDGKWIAIPDINDTDHWSGWSCHFRYEADI